MPALHGVGCVSWCGQAGVAERHRGRQRRWCWGTQDRTNLAFAALQLNRDRGFNELVYGIVSAGTPLLPRHLSVSRPRNPKTLQPALHAAGPRTSMHVRWRTWCLHAHGEGVTAHREGSTSCQQEDEQALLLLLCCQITLSRMPI